ncbi:MAG TPA: metallophosphoesterase [Actinomycetota bacterium]|nr:metallophosphoesterase [Actinomycetota bacterium]
MPPLRIARAGRGPRSRAWVLAAGCFGAAVAYAAVGLLPAVIHRAGPATLETMLAPGTGQTVLRIPPLGTVRAETHTPPVAVRMTLSEVDVPRLSRRVGDAAARADLADAVEDDLRALAPRLAWQTCLGATLLGGLVVAVLPRRRRAYVVAGGAGGLVAAASLVGGVAVSFDVAAFEEPRFTGALVRAPVVIDALQSGQVTLGSIQSRYETAADRLSDLLTLVAEPNQDPAAEDSVAILHVSDIHSNPLGVQLARKLAERFDVDAVLDTGDLTNFGVSVEARIGQLVERIDAPYLLVPGNHDSAANEAALDRVENLTVLDGRVADVEGVRILGWGDPTDTNWNNIPPDEAAQLRVEEGEETAAEIQRVSPDVLAVHDSRLAEASFGEVPLVLSGHYHRRISEEEDGTLVLAVGSTGATGLKFFVEAARDYEAEVLYFREGRAVAVDYVRFSGLGGEFEIERDTLGDELPEADEPPQETPRPDVVGDLDGDGGGDVVSLVASGAREWRVRARLANGDTVAARLPPVDRFTRPEVVGAADADGDGDDEVFVNVVDFVYHGGTTSVLGLFALRDGDLERVTDARGRPLDVPVGGVSNFGEGLECRDLDGDGVPEIRLLRIDSASSARSRWIEQVYRWRGEELKLVRTVRGTLRRRGFDDPRVLRFYELHCGALDPPFPF